MSLWARTRKAGRRLRWRWCAHPFGYFVVAWRWARRTANWLRYRWRVREGVPLDVELFTTMVRRRQYFESVRWDAYLRRDPCCYCYRVFPVANMTVEHVIPLGRGGADRSSNKVGCCRACNNRRGALPLMLYLMRRQNLNRRAERFGMTGDQMALAHRGLDFHRKGPLRVPLGDLARWT